MRTWICIVSLAALASPSSARTWRVEKDASGDFTVIQDALDVAASGDSVLVGPGRYADFRVATTLDGFTFSSIAHMKTSDVVLLGAGMDQTTIGPATLVVQVDGLNATCLVVDEVPEVVVCDLAFENAQFPVNLKYRSLVERCRINNTGTNWGLTIIEGDSVSIQQCEFLGRSSIVTSSSLVTSPQILDCAFEGPGDSDEAIVIGNGATGALIARCRFTGYASGIETSFGGTAIIEDCHFGNLSINIIDLDSGAMVMRRCRIEPGARFPLRVNIGRLEVYDSVIGGGSMATILTAGEMYVRNSHILNGGSLTIDSIALVNETVDLRFNWWGTTELATIGSWIQDVHGAVLYNPVLDGPVPTRVESMGNLKARFDQLVGPIKN